MCEGVEGGVRRGLCVAKGSERRRQREVPQDDRGGGFRVLHTMLEKALQIRNALLLRAVGGRGCARWPNLPAQLSAGDGAPLDVSQARKLLEGLCLKIEGLSCVADPRAGLGEAQVMLRELVQN